MATLNEKLNLPPEYEVDNQLVRGKYRFNTKLTEWGVFDIYIYHYLYLDDKEYYHPDGKWGCVDEEGNIVIEPIYDVMLPLYILSNRIIAGKIVNRKLKCGIIDFCGNEIVPFQYAQLHDVESDDAIAFSMDGKTYGLVDLLGNMIIEPMFDFIEYYNSEHHLIVLGEHEEPLSLYSIDLGKVVLPPLYDYFDFQETGVECELYNDIKFEFYRYEDLK